MKKLIFLLGFLGILGFCMNADGQTPVSGKTSTTNRVQNNASNSADRHNRKGDSQLNRANSSYQRAQSTSTNRPATTTANRPTTTTSTTTTTTTNRNPKTNTTTTTTPKKPVATSTTVVPSSNTNRTPATTTATTTTNRPATSSAGNPAKVTTTSPANEPKRGYDSRGQANPQPAPHGGRGNHTPGAPDSPNPNFGPAPYVSHNPHHFGSHVNVPPRVRPVYYGGIPFYFYNSQFCRLMNGYYVVCRPPLGAVIAYSIFNTWNPVIVIHNNRTYYYDDGTFYLPRNRDYVVVAPPIGALVAELPSNYETIVLEGRVYYKVDNVYYKEVIVNGYYWYEVLFVS